jgi:hypothetical protein
VSNDPLGLFTEKQPAPKEPGVGSFLQNIALISVLCICGAMWWDTYGGSFYDRRGDGDKDEQVEPAPIDKPASIVFVRELQNAPASEALLMREVRKLGIDFRDLDDDLDAAQKYLQYGLTKGVQPPLVVLQNAANQPYAVYSWPSLEQVKKWAK